MNDLPGEPEFVRAIFKEMDEYNKTYQQPQLTKYREQHIHGTKATETMWVLASAADADPKKKMEVDPLTGLIRQDRCGVYVWGASRTRERVERLLPDAENDPDIIHPVHCAKIEVYGTPAKDRELYFVNAKEQHATFEYLPRHWAEAARVSHRWIQPGDYLIVRTATAADLDSYHSEWGC